MWLAKGNFSTALTSSLCCLLIGSSLTTNARAQSSYRSNGLAPDQMHDQNQLNAAADKLSVDTSRLQSEQAEVEEQIGVLRNAEEQALNYKPIAENRLSQLRRGHFSIGSPEAKEMYVLKNWLDRESNMQENLDDQIADLNQRLIQLRLNQEDDQTEIKRTQQRLDEDSRSTAAFRNTLYNVNQNLNNNGYYYNGGRWYHSSQPGSTTHTRMVPGYH